MGLFISKYVNFKLLNANQRFSRMTFLTRVLFAFDTNFINE